MDKFRIYLIGAATLLLFPLPAYFILHYVEGWSFSDFFQLHRLSLKNIILGANLGMLYAFFAIFLLSTPFLKYEKIKQAQLLQQLNLNSADIIFLSLCAGIGEELLFRIGIQFYLGPLLTSLLFVALHGYYSFTNWRINLYGLLITPFILILAYSIDTLGLWFCISAHFTYDLVMFVAYARKRN